MINTRTQNMLIAIDININKWLRNRKIRDGGARKTRTVRDIFTFAVLFTVSRPFFAINQLIAID